MKKLIALILVLVCVLSLAGCNKPEPKLIHKTYTGEITEITDTTITIIYYGGANREVSFEITDLTIAMPSDLAVGDEVSVEAEYTTETDEPTYEPTTETSISSGKWTTISSDTITEILDEIKVYGSYADYIYNFISPRGTDPYDYANSDEVSSVLEYAIVDILTGNVYKLIPGIIDFKINFKAYYIKTLDNWEEDKLYDLIRM